MFVYKATLSKFIADMDKQTIVDQILDGFKKNNINAPSKGEVISWRNSLIYMQSVLNNPSFSGDCGVALEYRIPISGQRVDFILSGLHGSVLQTKNLQHSAIIIELKQWESIEIPGGLNDVVKVLTWVGGRTGEHPHPSYQAWSYAQVIEKYNEAVESKQIALHPCAFLHNYKKVVNDPLLDARYETYLELAPAFCHGEIPKLREYICQRISEPDHGKVLSEIESGKIRPSKSLQDALAQLL